MQKVIDTPWNVTRYLDALRAINVETIIRYFNRTSSAKLPEKRIEKPEATAIAEAGIRLCTIYQQNGGQGGKISDFGTKSGFEDADRAIDQATKIGQPKNSAIYFSVDHDFYNPSDLAAIVDYFAAAASRLKGNYKVGVYGSGTVGKAVTQAGHAELIWLAAAMGWSGTKDLLRTDKWALYQKWPSIDIPLPHDTNVVSSAWPNYGQFIPGLHYPLDFPPVHTTTLMEVNARGGLNLRRGPGDSFERETTLPNETIVHALSRQGDWVQADLEGDGKADGYVHADFLKVISGGFPIAPPLDLSSFTRRDALVTPYDIARAELALNIREYPGAANNPRIILYHSTTRDSDGDKDSTPWCSSFVNYCVEQSGRIGTKSKRALDWQSWGDDVLKSPQEGDIVVFERVGSGGHVGFFVADLGERLSILGGNQSDRISIFSYPKDGKLGGFTYKLRAIRRG